MPSDDKLSCQAGGIWRRRVSALSEMGFPVMKKTTLIASIVCVFALLLALSACGKADGDAFIGTWELDSIEAADASESVTADDLAQMESLGIELQVDLAILEDGTASFNLFGTVLDGTWAVEDEEEITLTFANDEATDTFDGTISDDLLRLEVGDEEVMYFHLTEEA